VGLNGKFPKRDLALAGERPWNEVEGRGIGGGESKQVYRVSNCGVLLKKNYQSERKKGGGSLGIRREEIFETLGGRVERWEE